MSIKNYLDEIRDTADPVILAIIDDRTGNEIIQIKSDGNVVLPNKGKVENASLEFWQNVANMIPVDEREKFIAKLNLIKAYSLLTRLTEVNAVREDKLLSQERDQLHQIMRDIEAYFYHQD
jgi:hypothetical protein